MNVVTVAEAGVTVDDGTAAATTSPMLGWYPDPEQRFESRLWSGVEWTQQVYSGGSEAIDAGFMPISDLRANIQIPSRVASVRLGAPPSNRSDWTRSMFNSLFSQGQGRQSRSQQGTWSTSLSVSKAHEAVVRLLQGNGATVTAGSRSDGRIDGTLRVQGEANTVLFIVLLCIWILPGLVYYFWARQEEDQSFYVTLAPEGSGTRVTFFGSTATFRELKSAFQMLPV